MRRFAGRVVWGAIAGMWKRAFGIAGRLSRSRGAALPSLQPAETVLVIAPHPDDETLGCGGAIAWHVRAGATVRVLVLTDGRRSRAATPAQRATEAQQAAAILGGSWELCSLPEGEWEDIAAVTLLRNELRDRPPSVIYAPSAVDHHPEHVRVAAALAHVLREALNQQASLPDPSPVIRVYEISVPLGPSLVTHLLRLDCASALAKDAALRAYHTQRIAIAAVRLVHAYNRALFGTAEEVEVFWQMTARQYCALMQKAKERPEHFRGVRHRPLTDPLCYLVGRQARARLRRAAFDVES